MIEIENAQTKIGGRKSRAFFRNSRADIEHFWDNFETQSENEINDDRVDQNNNLLDVPDKVVSQLLRKQDHELENYDAKDDLRDNKEVKLPENSSMVDEHRLVDGEMKDELHEKSFGVDDIWSECDTTVVENKLFDTNELEGEDQRPASNNVISPQIEAPSVDLLKSPPSSTLSTERSISPNRDQKKLRRRSAKIREESHEKEIDWSQFESQTDQSEDATVDISQSDSEHNENIRSEVTTESEDNGESAVEELERFDDNIFKRNQKSEILKINSVDGQHGLIITKSVRRKASHKDRFSFEYSDDDCYESNVKSPIEIPDNEPTKNENEFINDFKEFENNTQNVLKEFQDDKTPTNLPTATDDLFFFGKTDDNLRQHSARSRESGRYSAASSELYESENDYGSTLRLNVENEENNRVRRKPSIKRLFKKNQNKAKQNEDQNNEDLSNLLQNKDSVFQKKKRRFFPFMKKKKSGTEQMKEGSEASGTCSTASSLDLNEDLQSDSPADPKQLETDIITIERLPLITDIHNQQQNSGKEVVNITAPSNANPPKENTIENLTLPETSESKAAVTNQQVPDELSQKSLPVSNPEKEQPPQTTNQAKQESSKKEDLITKHLFTKLGQTVENLSSQEQILEVGIKLLRKLGCYFTEEDFEAQLRSPGEVEVDPNLPKKSQFVSKRVLGILKDHWISLGNKEIETELVPNLNEEQTETTNEIKDQLQLSNQNADTTQQYIPIKNDLPKSTNQVSIQHQPANQNDESSKPLNEKNEEQVSSNHITESYFTSSNEIAEPIESTNEMSNKRPSTNGMLEPENQTSAPDFPEESRIRIQRKISLKSQSNDSTTNHSEEITQSANEIEPTKEPANQNQDNVQATNDMPSTIEPPIKITAIDELPNQNEPIKTETPIRKESLPSLVMGSQNVTVSHDTEFEHTTHQVGSTNYKSEKKIQLIKSLLRKAGKEESEYLNFEERIQEKMKMDEEKKKMKAQQEEDGEVCEMIVIFFFFIASFQSITISSSVVAWGSGREPKVGKRRL
ncbi:uncharacterized protein [Clytia hemisphaerica]|uniref:uncharacterized protein n=1 Tax=Clytia hemisphaerica TaxID=252671 RepID=UPI0034D730DE